MSTGRPDLPTLTEVVDLTTPAKRDEVLPLQSESVAMESPASRASSPFQTPDGVHLLQQLPASARVPAPAQALAYDEELVAPVMVRLQPRLEAWVEAQVRRALMEMLPVWAESASLSIVRDLRAEMPELLSVALDEVHRQRHG